MATPAQWIEGARLRTLPMALAPVVAGSAAAQALHSFDPVRALLALLVLRPMRLSQTRRLAAEPLRQPA